MKGPAMRLLAVVLVTLLLAFIWAIGINHGKKNDNYPNYSRSTSDR